MRARAVAELTMIVRATVVALALVTPASAVATASADPLDAAPVILGTSAPLPKPPHPGGPIADTLRVQGHLAYFGGPIISSVDVVQVLWGDGDYLGNVRGTVSPTIGDFYRDVLASPYVDWLSEYDTPSQDIGRGTFQGRFMISPAITATTVLDAQVVAELARQIGTGHLPAPNDDTYYAVFFPAGITILSGDIATCVTACAWHSVALTTVGKLRYGVHPDLRGNCGCAPHGDVRDFTSVASHELIEAVTDPDVGAGPAWYDFQSLPVEGGEIGDICAWDEATIAGPHGVEYTVQKEWSNEADACIVAKSDRCGNGTLDPNEECDDGNRDAGDGCSPDCFVEPSCPSWEFLADVSVPAGFFDVPGIPGRQSGAQVAPDGTVLVSKDVGGQRWAITFHPASGDVIGNVYDPTSGGALFLFCEPLVPEGTAGPADQWRCFIASACASTGRQSNVQTSPSGITTLISKDVGDERWAILRRGQLVTGNVFTRSDTPPVFLYCVPDEADPSGLDCLASDTCTNAADCPTLWHSIGAVTHVPAGFFDVPLP